MSVQILLFERESPEDLEFYCTQISREIPGVSLATASTEEEALARANSATALFAKAPSISPALINSMPNLEWIQALTTGTDNLEQMSLPPSVTLTSARGIHGPQMSELALTLMMALARDLPRMLKNQARARWERWPQQMLAGKTVVLVGVGSISEHLAARCQAMNMRVLGVSTARTEVPGFDHVYTRTDLREAASLADFLVVLLPYDTSTHHIIGSEVIEAMRPTSRLINLSRGRVVDESALLAALQSQKIAGAGLDVFAVEPLPADSPFWALPNVIVTPHIGGMSDDYARQLMPLIVQNLRAYLSGNDHMMRNLLKLGQRGRRPDSH